MITISLKKSTGFSVIGGLIAGTLMLIPMMGLAIMMGMPAESFSSIIGFIFVQDPEQATIIGMILHYVASILIAIIFGIGTGISSKLSLTSFKKSIGLAIIPTVGSYLLLSIPLIQIILPPIMTQIVSMMGPDMTTQMVAQQVHSMQSLMMMASFSFHIFYAVILGVVVYGLLKKSSQADTTT